MREVGVQVVVRVCVQGEPAKAVDLDVAGSAVLRPDAGVNALHLKRDANRLPHVLNGRHDVDVRARVAGLALEREVGDTSLRQELLGLSGVIGQIGSVGIPARSARAEPARGNLASAAHDVVQDLLAVDGEGERLTHAIVRQVGGGVVQRDEHDAQGVVQDDLVGGLGILRVLLQERRVEVAPVNFAGLEGVDLGGVVVVEDVVHLIERRLSVIVGLVLHEDNLGGVIVLGELVLAGADHVEAHAPILAGGLAGVLREDVGIRNAQVVDEGDHRRGKVEGEVTLVLDGDALVEVLGLAGQHLLGASQHVIHIGGLGGGGGLEHTLEGVLHVFGGQRGTVMEGDALLDLARKG